MTREIDYDKGVIIKIIGRLNMEVFMYRDNPGVYLSAHGKPVPVALAAEAGYDVGVLERIRNKKLRIATAAKLIEAEEHDQELSPTPRKVVWNKVGYKVVTMGGGRHMVEDPDGNCVTPGVMLSREAAINVATAMAEEITPVESLPQTEPGPVAPGPDLPGRDVEPGPGTALGPRKAK